MMDSDFQDFLRSVIFPLIWIVLALFLFDYFQRRRDRDRFQNERDLKKMEIENQRYISHQSSRNIESADRYTPRLLDDLIYRFKKLEDKLNKSSIQSGDIELSTRLDSILDSINHRQNVPFDNSEQLIRELSHSLNTPLFQIEVSSSLALSSTENQKELEDSLQAILNSVQVCKAFLGAYRELVTSESASVWNPKSIRQAVESAFKVYAESQQKLIMFEMEDLPEIIEGYSNNYISALVLPLLENAVESSQNKTRLTVGFKEKINENILFVCNEPENEPGGNEIYDQGYTTKEDHEGTGLTSVKHLLSAIRGASLDHKFESNKATFRISLPRRMK